MTYTKVMPRFLDIINKMQTCETDSMAAAGTNANCLQSGAAERLATDHHGSCDSWFKMTNTDARLQV